MLNKKALGATAAANPVYVEDVFSTYLFTDGNKTITNGIDFSGEGGLLWYKSRDGTSFHRLTDTERGASNALYSNATNAQQALSEVSSFNSNGFTITSYVSGENIASWSFRKAEKFFDVVTYTGNGANNRQISHNLGSAPGCVIVKRTDSTGAWAVWHRSFAGTNYNAYLNTAAAAAAETDFSSDGSGTMTSTSFCVNNAGTTNNSGATYVAYLFAHDAGGFGLSGSENVISCGQTSLDSNGFATVNLGYEPQFVIIKSTEYLGPWGIMDTTRGANALSSSNLFSAFSAQRLNANSSSAESNSTDYAIAPNATGFTISATGYAGAPYDNFVYIAIRRGPMKTPESGTEVFNTIVRAGTGTAASITTVGFPPDMMISHSTNTSSNNVGANDKLRGAPQFLSTNTTNAEITSSGTLVSFDQNGFSVGSTTSGPFNISGQTNAHWNFRRAPGFFDVVCFSAPDGSTTQTHNLKVKPDLMICKCRSTADSWYVWEKDIPNNALDLNSNQSTAPYTNPEYVWGNGTNVVQPTTTQFTFYAGNTGTNTYVWYGFASVAGVSKVGSYTGTGTTQQINCGFTSGARFVLIKRTDSTGDWYVWDSARGIVAGNDPYLLLNSTAAEVTNTDYIDTYSSGFEISSTAPAAINANGGTFIYLAIA